VVGLCAISALAIFGVGTTASAVAAKPPAQKLTISPSQDTPTANAKTQISILGAPKSTIKSVVVTGTVSGSHTGTLKSYSGNRGASFIPDVAFTPGESVTATIKIQGKSTITRNFTIAVLGFIPPNLPITTYQQDKLHHYVTEPDLLAPKITINKSNEQTSTEGKIFFTPLPSPAVHPGTDNPLTFRPVGPGGPLITSPKGSIVWFKPVTPPAVAANLDVQKYQGKKVLTWWEGPVTLLAFGQGEATIANTNYKTIATVKAGNGFSMDLHEFHLNSAGDALFTIYQPVMVHLPDTPDGTLTRVLDSIVQEVDVKTGLVTWEWHSYGHIPLSESYVTPATSPGYDAYHLNSAQQLDNGKVLVSARDTSAVYKIDQASGKINWTLGGLASDFKMKKGVQFYFQHHARVLNNGDISIFDDGAGPPQYHPYGRGIVVKLDQNKKTATLVDQYHRDTTTSPQSEGSVQKLSTGNTFVGYGAEPYFSEFNKKGKLIYDGNLPVDDGSYRTFRYKWSGMPTTKPKAAVVATGDSTDTIYVSWNGATQVSKWQVLGLVNGAYKPILKTNKKGLETKIDVKTSATSFKVRALDAKGRKLSVTPVVTTVPAG